MSGGRDIRDRVRAGPGSGPQAATGRLRWSPVKSLWFWANAVAGLIGVIAFASWGAFTVFLGLSVLTLCGGHSLGMHRRLIHEAYDCPPWLERCGIHLACLVGLGGPVTMMRAHDLRDWAQRQADCHPFYSQRAPFWRDMWVQLNLRYDCATTPEFVLPERVAADPWMRALQATSMLQNLALGGVLFALDGWGWALWGVGLRVAVSMLGHAAVEWFAHNRGSQDWIKPTAAIQGHNVAWFGLISFGEAYHNNHHAFPECANYGLMEGQWDLGFWVLERLRDLGLVWNLRETPETLHGDEAPVAV